ncbi:MAG: nucleotide sugar dehydrogenase [Solirubrobacteraceae bacterium]|nr:nucleotide sugar dehydrogenase [Solirubrobacteraceae bacterium]
MRAVVVALGKIGLPIAVHIARAGHDVVGCDIDPRVRDAVAAGRAPFPGEAHLDDYLTEVVDAGRLTVSGDTTAAVAAGADLVIVVPPLIVDREARPDWRVMDAALTDVGRGLQAGTVVSVETTLPTGSTRSRVAPMLADLSGLRSEADFFTVHSPERVFSGRIFADLETYPKLVGGLTDAGEARAVELYRTFIRQAEVWGMGSAEAAELAKLAETTYRDINIAFANELARHADAIGVDVDRVIDASNSQPFSHIHRPGIAVGGHCIPVYPRFYLAGDPDARVPAAARASNLEMPSYAVDLLRDLLGGSLDGARVHVLGAAYRGGVKETAFSGVFDVFDALRDRGATPLVSDPLYTDDELRALGLEPFDGHPVDGVIVQADHAEYRDLAAEALDGARAVVDGRGVVDVDALRAAGVAVKRIGRP